MSRQTGTITAKDPDDLPQVAEQLVELLNTPDQNNKKVNLVLFSGTMGSGKTTLIKEICSAIKVYDNVTSPTFALINEYTTQYGVPVYHFDFYRINSLEEVYDLGFEEYFFSGNLCLIEWPEKVMALIPENDEFIRIAQININVTEKGQREISYLI